MKTAPHTDPLITALTQIGPHNHVCSIYETQQEQFEVAIPFIKIGLERGERCIYIADDHALASFRDAISKEGVDVESAVAARAVVLIKRIRHI